MLHVTDNPFQHPSAVRAVHMTLQLVIVCENHTTVATNAGIISSSCKAPCSSTAFKVLHTCVDGTHERFGFTVRMVSRVAFKHTGLKGVAKQRAIVVSELWLHRHFTKTLWVLVTV
jgi:hypothetical protein